MAYLKDSGTLQKSGGGSSHAVSYLNDKVRELEASIKEKDRLLETLDRPKGSKYGGN